MKRLLFILTIGLFSLAACTGGDTHSHGADTHTHESDDHGHDHGDHAHPHGDGHDHDHPHEQEEFAVEADTLRPDSLKN